MKLKSVSSTYAFFLSVLLSSFAVLHLVASGQGRKSEAVQSQIEEANSSLRLERQDRVGLTATPKNSFGSIVYTLLISARAVIPGSAASIAGLEPGDLITRIGGMSVRGVQTLRAIETCTPGTSIELEYGRPSEDSSLFRVFRVQVTLDAARENLGSLDQASEARLPPFDLAYQDQVLLTQQPARSSLGIIGDVLIRLTYVEPRSPADQAGLKPGDLITEIGGLPVRGVQTFRAVGTEPAGTLVDVVYLRKKPSSVTNEKVTTRVALAPLERQQK